LISGDADGKAVLTASPNRKFCSKNLALLGGIKANCRSPVSLIENEAQLQQSLEQIENLCQAVQSLRTRIFPKNPRNFAILAEGPVDEIRKLQMDIDDYLTRLESASADALS